MKPDLRSTESLDAVAFAKIELETYEHFSKYTRTWHFECT